MKSREVGVGCFFEILLALGDGFGRFFSGDENLEGDPGGFEKLGYALRVGWSVAGKIVREEERAYFVYVI